MKLPLSLYAILVSSGLALSGNPVGYRSFVASDAIQSDLKGPVRLVKTQTFEGEEGGTQKLVAESSTSYDSQGYLLEDKNTDLEEKGSEVVRRLYDNAGDLVAEVETGRTQIVRKKIRLDPQQRKVFWEIDRASGPSLLLSEMTFDRFGKEGEGRDYDENGQVRELYKTRRDGAGKEVEVIFSDPTGRPKDITKTTWDRRGFDVTEEHESKAEKFIVKTKNEYPEVDSQGNWLRQISTSDFFEQGRKILTIRKITIRTIDYHP